MTKGIFETYKEFKELSDDQLRELANRCLRDFAEPQQPAMNTALLLQAQLYMTELDRRENAVVSARDFNMARRSYKMEIWVIVLIGLEIVLSIVGLVYGFHEGNKQQTVLENMRSNTEKTAASLDKQAQLLSIMNSNTRDTVQSIGELQHSQGLSLNAQRDTVSSITKMNSVLQHELDLAFEVSVHLAAEDETKRIRIVNLSKTAIYVWGIKYADQAPRKFENERFIAPGASYEFFIEPVYDEAARLVPKGSERRVLIDYYIRGANGKPYIAHNLLLQKWENDKLKFFMTTVSLKQEAWPAEVDRQ